MQRLRAAFSFVAFSTVAACNILPFGSEDDNSPGDPVEGDADAATDAHTDDTTLIADAARDRDAATTTRDGGSEPPLDAGVDSGHVTPPPDSGPPPPVCTKTKGSTTGTSDICFGAVAGSSSYCPTSCGAGHYYSCQGGSTLQPAGLSCITVADQGYPPYVCCSENRCVRYATIDGQCGGAKGYFCGAEAPRPPGCTNYAPNPTYYACCTE